LPSVFAYFAEAYEGGALARIRPAIRIAAGIAVFKSSGIGGRFPLPFHQHLSGQSIPAAMCVLMYKTISGGYTGMLGIIKEKIKASVFWTLAEVLHSDRTISIFEIMQKDS
jgi:hypothetical protein